MLGQRLHVLTMIPRIHLTGYHDGELEAQGRAGLLAQQKAQHISGLFATRPVSEQLQAFFSDLRLLFTAVRQVSQPTEILQAFVSLVAASSTE